MNLLKTLAGYNILLYRPGGLNPYTQLDALLNLPVPVLLAHAGKGEETALMEAVRNNTAVPQQGNNGFLARRSVFLDRGPPNG